VAMMLGDGLDGTRLKLRGLVAIDHDVGLRIVDLEIAIEKDERAALLRLAQKIPRDIVQALERLGGADHELNRQTTPGGGRNRPGSSTPPPGKTAKRKKPAPPSIQYTISAVPSRAPVESVSPSPRDKDQLENR
jgi:hypothetical protein